jgi:hypothetical protein
MAELTSVTQFIASVGFPIACCCYLFFERFTKTAKLIDVIQNNTIALNLIEAKLKK